MQTFVALQNDLVDKLTNWAVGVYSPVNYKAYNSLKYNTNIPIIYF